MNILELINKKRNIELGLTKGFSDNETIQCSQSLDALLNIYRKQKTKEKLTSLVV